MTETIGSFNYAATQDEQETKISSLIFGAHQKDLTAFVKRSVHRMQVNALSKALTDKFGNSSKISEKAYLWESDDVHIFLMEDRFSISVFAKSYKKAAEGFAEFECFCTSMDAEEVSVTTYYHNGSYLDESVFDIDVNLLNVYEELYPDIDVKILLEQFILAKENILILYGPPGTGKTSFLKYMLKQGLSTKKSFLYLKGQKLFEHDLVWHKLADSRRDFVLLDDLDVALTRSANNDFVSRLLSLSDGVLCSSTKIIITTNQEIKDIDSALVRPGRCFDFMILEAMPYSYALDLWIKKFELPEDKFVALYKKNDKVSQASFMSNVNRLKSNCFERSYVKNGSKHYTLEQKFENLGIHTGQQKVGFGLS